MVQKSVVLSVCMLIGTKSFCKLTLAQGRRGRGGGQRGPWPPVIETRRKIGNLVFYRNFRLIRTQAYLHVLTEILLVDNAYNI